jgi:hypothetical protein
LDLGHVFGCRADDGDRGVCNGEVFVLLEGIGECRETVVDQRREVGYGLKVGYRGV